MNKIFESESCRHYISLLQENITRMASNCTSCKTWSITIVSALLALGLTSNSLKTYLWVVLIPAFLFYLLDAYYLGQEKKFRDIESEFIRKVKAGDDVNSELYTFSVDRKEKKCYFWHGLASFSSWLLFFAVFSVVCMLYLFV